MRSRVEARALDADTPHLIWLRFVVPTRRVWVLLSCVALLNGCRGYTVSWVVGIGAVVWLIAGSLIVHHSSEIESFLLRIRQAPGGRLQGVVDSTKVGQRLRNSRRAKAVRVEEVRRLRIQNRFRSVDDLRRLSPREFECAIAELFELKGYAVSLTPAVNDGGFDAIARKDGKKFLIECKRWKKFSSIGRPVIQQFLGAMVSEKADGGFFVTTGRFSKPAIEYAAEQGIKLWEPEQIAKRMNEVASLEHSAEYRQLCRECGDLVVFAVRDRGTQSLCRNRHTVICDAPSLEELLAGP